MVELGELTKRIEVIEARNSKVELDKQWETSTFRKAFLLAITYVLLAVYMTLIDVNKPWLNAIIPSLGFLISTLTLGWVKAAWINKRRS